MRHIFLFARLKAVLQAHLYVYGRVGKQEKSNTFDEFEVQWDVIEINDREFDISTSELCRRSSFIRMEPLIHLNCSSFSFAYRETNALSWQLFSSCSNCQLNGVATVLLVIKALDCKQVNQ